MPHPVRWCWFASLQLLLIASLAPVLRAAPVTAWPDPAREISLNGTWEFAYRAGPATAPAPTQFSAITVPGHWELQGFAEPRYGRELAEGTGYYRRTFKVPAAWSGQRVMLRCDGVLSGFEARVNGTSVGSWASGYNPATFDITDAVRVGADNELAITVSTRSHGWEFDTNDCWSLSGIYRDVTLFAVPPAHLEGVALRTEIAPDGSATLTVGTQVNDPLVRMQGRLIDPNGQLIAALDFATDQSTRAHARLSIPHAQLWTAETPALHTLELSLSSGQAIRLKVGLREVRIVDGVLQLNGRPIKLRGIDHHDLWPDTGRATDDAQLRRDLELIKGANCNFVRTSHYPPHPRLLELCDELGLYVMDEVPFGFGEEHLNDEAYRPDLLGRAESTVRRDGHHASVIVWSVGNENPNTPLTIATARRVKELDPTRPVCFPQIGSYFAQSFRELPNDIDLYAPHYPSTATVRDYATSLTRPVIFTEYAHALGLAMDQVQAQWAIIQASPQLAGGAIWMFQDQGIRRTAKPGETPATSHDLGLAVWPDEQHYFDTHGNQGTDGIVYADRTPQVDYWQVRKVYSPIQIAETELAAPPTSAGLRLQLENRLDFRSLDGITLEWSLRQDGHVRQQGSQPLRTASRASETIVLPITPPAGSQDCFNWLDLRCVDANGTTLYERGIRVGGPIARSAFDPLLAAVASGAATLEETPAEIRVRHAHGEVTLNRATGEFTLRSAGGDLIASGLQPHAGRRLTEGEIVRAKKENPWTDALLPAGPGVETRARRVDGGIVLTARGRFPCPDAAEQALAGSIELRVRDNGTLDVDYDFAPTDSRGLLLEAGIALRGAPAATEFLWAGNGPYAGYPGKDALNEFGIHHLTRADLNFSGNRRQVELAVLAAPSGAGVLLVPAERADIAVEDTTDGVILSHNALVSGRGTKFVAPDTAIRAEESPRITGKFSLVPLGAEWPAPVRAWFGAPRTARPFQPFFHGYDR